MSIADGTDRAIDGMSSVACGHGTPIGCKKAVPTGRCHCIINYRCFGEHVLFCETCCPCGTGSAGLHRHPNVMDPPCPT